jgi:hypothetical protein
VAGGWGYKLIGVARVWEHDRVPVLQIHGLLSALT